MNDTVITFRTDKKLKNEATAVFENVGINLSSAINMFLRQAVIKRTFPCAIDSEIAMAFDNNYNDKLVRYFGSGKDLDLDEEPKELKFSDDKREDL